METSAQLSLTFESTQRSGNFGIWHRSPILKKTLLALIDASEHRATSKKIHELTGSMAVHSDIDALRANGFAIPKARCIGKDPDTGRRVYEYQLIIKEL